MARVQAQMPHAELHRLKAALLKEYVRKHGWEGFSTGRTLYKGYNLGTYVMRNRTCYRNGALHDYVIELMEDIPGFSWEPRKEQNDEMIRVLRRYIDRYGWDKFRYNSVYQGRKLGVYVITRRNEYKNGVLTIYLKKKLERIPGWKWSVIPHRHVEKAKLLREFIKRYGWENFVIGKTVYKNTTLGHWVYWCRQSYKRGSLADNVIELCESIPGWHWRVKKEKFLMGSEKHHPVVWQ